ELLATADRGLGVGSATGVVPDELARAASLAEQGTFLAEDPYAEFADGLRARVDRARRDVLRALARHHEAAGDVIGARAWASRLAEAEPDDLRAQRELARLVEAEDRPR
ncbi:MAG TPA: hypothetical protein VHK88_12305, partial [Aquihabitans sp.]|nr:hypothetical protein [Aquihabitans sp.]